VAARGGIYAPFTRYLQQKRRGVALQPDRRHAGPATGARRPGAARLELILGSRYRPGYHDPLSVGTGAVLALWAVAAIAIAGGRGLLKIIPLKWITRIAAAIMLALAGISLAAALS
jgi:hypothetical protein